MQQKLIISQLNLSSSCKQELENASQMPVHLLFYSIINIIDTSQHSWTKRNLSKFVHIFDFLDVNRSYNIIDNRSIAHIESHYDIQSDNFCTVNKQAAAISHGRLCHMHALHNNYHICTSMISMCGMLIKLS